MHVKAKKMAFSGILLALTEVFIALGSILETSTLFLLAAASYFVGIVFREFGRSTGGAFYLAGVLLGVFLSPNKFYVLTYAGMGLYIFASEISWQFLGGWNQKEGAGTDVNFIRKKQKIFLGMKYAIFNLMFLPAVCFLQEFMFGKKLPGGMLAGILFAGQFGLFVYDCAYEYVQRELWGKIRGRFTW